MKHGDARTEQTAGNCIPPCPAPGRSMARAQPRGLPERAGFGSFRPELLFQTLTNPLDPFPTQISCKQEPTFGEPLHPCAKHL